VEELESSTKRMSEMEGCTRSALSCVSMTFCVKLQIVTVQRYREVVCLYHYHHHHHHVRVGEISCSTMIVVCDAEMFIFCMLITYFPHEILRWQAPGPDMSGVVSQDEERPDKVRSVPAEYLSLHRRVRGKGRVQRNCKNKWED